MSKLIIFQISVLLPILLCPGTGCFVDSVCYNNADCGHGQWCEMRPDVAEGSCREKCRNDTDCDNNEQCAAATGQCKPAECWELVPCETGFECIDGMCVAEAPLTCPENMVAIENSFCIDVYEASRPDATATTAGTDNSRAASTPGVLPWKVSDNGQAQAACLASGKTLCSSERWERACQGPNQTTYAYGDQYESATCNGIDAFCLCDSCASDTTCSYPGCYPDCGASFRSMPTGSFPGCTNGYGVFDMNGNLWEHVLNGNDSTIRGGAYNCLDSERLHRCDYVPASWTPSARGFRCCRDGEIHSGTVSESTP